MITKLGELLASGGTIKTADYIRRAAEFGRLPNQPLGTLGTIHPPKIRDLKDLKKQYQGPASEDFIKAYKEQQKAKPGKA